MGNKSFIEAVQKENEEKIKQIFHKGKNLDKRDNNSPLHVALRHRASFKIVSLLISLGADVKAVNNATILHTALKMGSSYEIIKLLIDSGCNLKAVNLNSLIHYAVIYQATFETIKLLIESGADFDSPNQNTPLLSACINSSPCEVISLLISSGASVSTSNKENCLHHICKHPNNESIVKLLISHGIDVNEKDKNTALHYSVWHKSGLEVAKILINSNAKVNLRNGNTPLHTALRYNPDLELIKLLVYSGADVNIADNNTPMHFVCSKHDPNEEIVEIVKFLLSTGANITKKNGESPIDLAKTKEIKDLFKCHLSVVEDFKTFLQRQEETNISFQVEDGELHLNKTILKMRIGEDGINQLKLLTKHQKMQNIMGLIKWIYYGKPPHKLKNDEKDKIHDNQDQSLERQDSRNFDTPFKENTMQSGKLDSRINSLSENTSITNTGNSPQHIRVVKGLVDDSFDMEKEEILEMEKNKFLNYLKFLNLGDEFSKKSYRPGLVLDLKKLWEDEESKDFKIIAENSVIKVHRAILYVRSELFRGMFLLNKDDKSDQVSDYSERSAKAISALMKFLYTDELDVDLDEKILFELEGAEDYYQLNENSSLPLQLTEVRKYQYKKQIEERIQEQKKKDQK